MAKPRNRGRQKPKLSDLGRTHPTDKEREKLKDQLTPSQSPIVTAIIGQNLLENELDTLLRPRFTRSDKATWNELTEARGPLSTFSQRITLAYALGIIDEVVRDGLNTVRHIRNTFAHSRVPINFEHHLIRKELRGVTIPPGKRSDFHVGMKVVQNYADRDTFDPAEGYGEEDSPPQGAYILLCAILESQLVYKQALRTRKALSRTRTSIRKQLAQALLDSRPRGLFGAPLPPAGYQSDDPRYWLSPLGLLGELDPEASPDDNEDTPPEKDGLE